MPRTGARSGGIGIAAIHDPAAERQKYRNTCRSGDEVVALSCETISATERAGGNRASGHSGDTAPILAVVRVVA